MNAGPSPDERELIILPNGARIVLDAVPNLATTAITVGIGAGARDETADQNGLAHFLEHMTFKGAAGMNAQQIAERVEDRGASANASTGYERTNYTVRCLSEDAVDMVECALSLALSADLPEGEIEREKQVVYQEIGEARDEMDDRVFDLLQATAWPDHSLGRPILGEEAILKTLTRESLAGFIERHYLADRTVVSIAGAFDRNAVIDTATRRLEGMRTGMAVERTAPVMMARSAFEKRKAEQSMMVFSRPAPSQRDQARFAARLLVEIMGGGMSSRLYQEIREKRGLAYAIDAYIDAYEDAGRIDVFCGCAPGDALEVQAVLKDVWADLAENGPTEAELARAGAVSRAAIAMSLESIAELSASSVFELLVHDQLMTVDWALEQTARTTIDDVRAVARAALDGPAAAAGIGPGPAARAVTAFVDS